MQLDSVNNSTNATGLVSIALALLSPTVTTDQHTQLQSLAGQLQSLTLLLQNMTNFLPTILAQSQENNRALAHLCDFTQFSTSTNYCATGSIVMVPSMLGMGVAVMVVVLVNVVDRFA